jgi:hypothetical protein
MRRLGTAARYSGSGGAPEALSRDALLAEMNFPSARRLPGAVRLPDGSLYLSQHDMTLPADVADFPFDNHGGLYRKLPQMVPLQKWYGNVLGRGSKKA